MSNALMHELIPVMILYTAISIFLIFAYRYLRQRRQRKQRQANTYPSDMEQFNKAVLNNDIPSIKQFGDRIIWNQHLEQRDKKIIYQAVQNRVKQHPELIPLWKEVYYKTHGHEPFEI